MRVGDVEVLVEALPASGSEQTSRAGAAVEGLDTAFKRAQATIVRIASSTAEMVTGSVDRSVHPTRLQIEFGISFSAQGHVVFTGATAGATLKVTLTYDGRAESSAPSQAP